MRSVDIVDALDRKYGQKVDNNEQWVVLREARSGAGHDGSSGQCDYLAINTYQSRGLNVVSHEIKVSMADWKRELEDPEKAELFAKLCRRWWVVMPSTLASKVKDEIPAAWGLMSVSEKGRITETRKAPARDPEEIPAWWWIGWLAQLDRRDKRSSRQEINKAVTERVEKAREHWEHTWSRNQEYQARRDEELRGKVEALRDATGIDLDHVFGPSIERLKRVWSLAYNGQDLERTVALIRESADLLEALVDPNAATVH